MLGKVLPEVINFAVIGESGNEDEADAHSGESHSFATAFAAYSS